MRACVHVYSCGRSILACTGVRRWCMVSAWSSSIPTGRGWRSVFAQHRIPVGDKLVHHNHSIAVFAFVSNATEGITCLGIALHQSWVWKCWGKWTPPHCLVLPSFCLLHIAHNPLLTLLLCLHGCGWSTKWIIRYYSYVRCSLNVATWSHPFLQYISLLVLTSYISHLFTKINLKI